MFDRFSHLGLLQVKLFVLEMDQASSSSNMKEDNKSSTDPVTVDDNEEREAIEIALFQVPECYVYLVNFQLILGYNEMGIWIFFDEFCVFHAQVTSFLCKFSRYDDFMKGFWI